MLRLSKLTDYGFVLLTHFAAHDAAGVHNAPETAAATGLPLPTVSKLLKKLARAGLMTARRGSKGGYEFARPPELITANDILSALEGPVALTDCSHADGCECEIQSSCRTKSTWRRINQAVQEALQGITLAEMAVAPSAIDRAVEPCRCGGHHEHRNLRELMISRGREQS